MCGICGIVNFSNKIEKNTVERMTQTLEHRGPDDKGSEVYTCCGLGHRRLSIIDISQAGHQPMQTEDGRYTIVYNGELYNFREIRRELEVKGILFNGHSDTEVVLKSYVEWGTDTFHRLEGMFAFAIWDKKEHSLVLCRDRFGIKPLYYYYNGKLLVFGSEIKALMASDLINKEINWQGVKEYLHYGSTLGATTFYNGVKKLQPNHYLKFCRGQIIIERYASIYELPENHDTYEEAVEKTKFLLEEAVRKHLVGDVPVGVFLSGGIDSSAITAFAAKHYTGKIDTFSVAFLPGKKNHNELPLAKTVAEKFNTEHHELFIKIENVPEIIEKLVDIHDEPFGDGANIPLYIMSRELKGEIKVILQGDGGDEIFAGYKVYERLTNNYMARILSPCYPVLSLINKLYIFPTRDLDWIYSSQYASPDLRMALMRAESYYHSELEKVFTEDIRQKLKNINHFKRYQECYEEVKKHDDVQKMLYTDCSILLPDRYLEKVDRPTMANSLEVRVPMLDTQLTRYVMSLPSEYKIRKGNRKRLLKESLRGVVPDEVLDSPKKGFGVPIKKWLKGSLAEYMTDVINDPSMKKHGILDFDFVNRLIKKNTSGRSSHHQILYKMLNFSLWYQKNF